MTTQKIECCRRIFHGFRFIDLLVKLNGLVPVVALISKLDTRLYAPEQIRTQGNKTVSRIPIGNAAHVVIHTEDLLEDDDAWSIATGWQSDVAVEFATVERFYCRHRWATDYTDDTDADKNLRDSGCGVIVVAEELHGPVGT